MDTERKMGYINERKRQQRREHKLRKFTTLFLIYWVGFSLTIMIFFKYKINELYELNRKTQLQIELLKEQLDNYNEKDIRKSNGGKYNTWTDEVCDNKQNMRIYQMAWAKVCVIFYYKNLETDISCPT